LSLLFHPRGQEISGDWPTSEQAESWEDLDVYLDGCRHPDFVIACREWSFEEAAGDLEVLACAYSLAVRQLRHEENEALSQAILEAAVRRMG
jgi:hypothetical protein